MDGKDEDGRAAMGSLLEKDMARVMKEMEVEDRKGNDMYGRDEDDLMVSTECGVGPCLPRAVRGWANINTFTLVACLMGTFRAGFWSYVYGVVRSIEKRFSLNSTQTGFVISTEDIAQVVTIIFIGYIGEKCNKARFLSVSMFLYVIGSFLFAAPFFIYGSADVSLVPPLPPPEVYQGLSHNISSPADKLELLQLCTANPGDVLDDDKCKVATSDSEINTNEMAYILMVVGGLLIGVGGSGTHTLAVSYIDENVKKEDAGLYIGIFTCCYPLSPILGYSLAILALRLPENMIGVSTLDPTDPAWVGCWWLGFVVFGILILFTVIPMFFFPKHLAYYYKTKKKQPIFKKPVAVPIRDRIVKAIKEFPAALWSLLRNPLFVILIMTKLTLLYIVVGVIINMPRYVEVHFQSPAYFANIISGAKALATAIGNLGGGLMMKFGRVQPAGSAKLLCAGVVITTAAVAIVMNLGCPQVPMAGAYDNTNSFKLNLPCNSNCSCSRDDYDPMCAADGTTYFSPCYAGCQQSHNQSFSDCACVSGDGLVRPGVCKTDCDLFLPYVIVSISLALIASICSVPGLVLILRSVGDHQKAIALALGGFIINALVFMPGPILFGAIIDSSCLVWKESCGQTGNCLFYDTNAFRLRTHGVTLGILIVSTLLSLIAVYLTIKRFGRKKDNKGEKHLHDDLLPEPHKATLDT